MPSKLWPQHRWNYWASDSWNFKIYITIFITGRPQYMDVVFEQFFDALHRLVSNCLMTKHWRQKITMIQFPPCAEICQEYELIFPMPPVPKIIFLRTNVRNAACTVWISMFNSSRNIEMESSLCGWYVKESTFSDLRMEGATSQQHHKPLFPNLFPFPIHAHLILMFTQPKTTWFICYSILHLFSWSHWN